MTFRAMLPRVRLHRPGVDVLSALCLLLVLVHVVIEISGGVEHWIRQGLYESLGLSRPGILDLSLWQIASHAFLHAGWWHLILNLTMIYLAGAGIHHILGGRAVALIFAGGVMAGSVLHLGLQPEFPIGWEGEPSFIPLVGASGGAMALVLALVTLAPDARVWPLPVSGKNLGRGILLAALLFYFLTPGLGLPGFSSVGRLLVDPNRPESGLLFRVGHLYHLGGGLLGWYYARRLLRPISLGDLRRARERRESGRS